MHLTVAGEGEDLVLGFAEPEACDEVVARRLQSLSGGQAPVVVRVTSGERFQVAQVSEEQVHLLLGVAGRQWEATVVGQDLGTPGIAVTLGDGIELAAHEIAPAFFVRQQSPQRLDAPIDLVELFLEAARLQVGESTEAHGQDRAGLFRADLQGRAQVLGRSLGRATGLDDLYDLVDAIEGDQKALEDVRAFLGPGKVEASAPNDHIEAVLDPDL